MKRLKRLSVLVLLVFAFAGGNLFMGSFYNSRGTKNSGERYPSMDLSSRRIKEQHTHTISTTKNLENLKTDESQPVYPIPSTKEQHTPTITTTRSLESVKTDDYRPVDPSPSTKARIRPGPIEHGAPILPYIPRYPPQPGNHKNVPPVQSPEPPFR